MTDAQRAVVDEKLISTAKSFTACFYDCAGEDLEVEADAETQVVYLSTMEGRRSTVAELTPGTARAIARALLDAADLAARRKDDRDV